jgi:hypothetical protein
MFYSKVPWSEDRFAETLEIRPGNRAVVHHAGVFVVDIPRARDSSTARWSCQTGSVTTDRGAALAGRADTPRCRREQAAVVGSGRGVDSHRADIGKRIPAGKYINWQMHYNPIGKETTDRSRLGIWFNKQKVTHELLIRQAGDRAGDHQGRPVALSCRGQGSRVQRRRRQHAPSQQDARTSRLTPRTGR